MVLYGLLGRRINKHPICRRCKFDLVGHMSDIERCPECGCIIRGKRDVRIGMRKRRLILALLGTLLILLNSAFLTTAAIGTARGIEWNQYKPEWWLVVEARSNDWSTVNNSITTLMDRWASGKLSEQTITSLKAFVLDAQGDPKGPWLAAWGDFIEEAWARGYLTENEKIQYAQNSIQISLEVRDKIVSGDKWTTWVHSSAHRRGNEANNWSQQYDTNHKGRLGFYFDFNRVLLDGKQLPKPERAELNVQDFSTSGTRGIGPLGLMTLTDEVGPHRLDMDLRVHIVLDHWK